MINVQVEDDSRPGFARPGEKAFGILLDEANRAIDDVEGVPPRRLSHRPHECWKIAPPDVQFRNHFTALDTSVTAPVDRVMVAVGITRELVSVRPVDLPVRAHVVAGIFGES